MDPPPRTGPDLRHVAGATAAVFAVTLGLMVGLLRQGDDQRDPAKRPPQAQKSATDARQANQPTNRPGKRLGRRAAQPVPGASSPSGSMSPSDPEPDVMFPSDEGGPPIR